MATAPVITGAPPRATPLSDLARTCALQELSADLVEQMGLIYLAAAAELRGKLH